MTDTDVRRIEDKVDGLALVLAELKGSLSPTLEKLTEKQDELGEHQKQYEAEVEKRFEKVEGRIDPLERFRFSVPSITVLSFLLTAAGVVYIFLHPGG